MRNRKFNVVPSGGGVGAFIEGVDLSLGLSKDAVKRIRAALGDYGVVFFREQLLSPTQHIAIAEQFGQINVNRFFPTVDGHPRIAEVRKEPSQGANIGGSWHTDHSYDEQPAMGSILIARETPPRGGDTLFASMFAAYESLSQGVKDALKPLQAWHSSRHAFGDKVRMKSNGVDERFGNPELALQDSLHPLVISHPISGRKALYVNPGFTIGIDGWQAHESAALLQMLYEHAARPEHTYRFQWQPGSIAFWDNRASWHYALNDYQGARRVMHRITLEGEALAA
jgi:taurine dioxygenase